MTPDDFKKWRMRMGGLTHNQTAELLKISFSTARCYSDGTRIIPDRIEQTCGMLEDIKNTKEIGMAKEKPSIKKPDQANIAAIMAAAYIQVRSKRSAVMAMTINRDHVEADMADMIEALSKHGVSIVAQNQAKTN